MPAEHESTENGGLTRRQLVTRGAIAGGLVWAAPVIRTTAAYATTANGTERPCQNFYMVVINPAGHVLPAPARIQYHTTPPKIRAWFRDNSGVTVQYPSIKPQLTAVSDEEAAVLLPEVTGPNAAGRQCRMVLGFARKGETSFSEAFIDPDPQIAVAVGRRIIFPCPRVDDRAASSVVDDTADTPTSSSTSSTTSSTSTTTTTAPGTVGSKAVDATGTPSTAANATLGADGSGGATLGSDGSSGPTLGSDGHQSGNGNSGGNGNGGGSTDHGNGHCFDSLYLIYCCPR
jgi:hypothetical protein